MRSLRKRLETWRRSRAWAASPCASSAPPSPGTSWARASRAGTAAIIRRERTMPEMTLPTPELIMESLTSIEDPELRLGIVDLGLIYDVNVDEDGMVDVVMT